MIKHSFKLLCSALIIFQLGCAADKEQSQQNINFNTINTYEDLSLLDPELSEQLVKEMNSSDWEDSDEETIEELNDKTPKILIVGDSWATLTCLYGAVGKVLKDVNAKLKNDRRCLRTSKLGIEAKEWVGSKQDQRTRKFLKKNKNIKYLYMSLGGNDLMASWTRLYTQEQTLKLFEDTLNHVKNIMNIYKAINPNIKIVLSGYDYPHFKPNHPIGLYRTIYERMLSPSDVEINKALIQYSQFMTAVADYKNTYYIHHLGISQYYDGVPERNLSKYKTLAPDFISTYKNPKSYGGNPEFPSSELSMINWLFQKRDAFHLNSQNYYNVVLHTYKNVISNILK